jgi:hypothetical protein
MDNNEFLGGEFFLFFYIKNIILNNEKDSDEKNDPNSTYFKKKN